MLERIIKQCELLDSRGLKCGDAHDSAAGASALISGLGIPGSV